MKRKLYLAAVAAVAFAACTEPVINYPETTEGCVKLGLSFSSSETKAVGTSDENRISNVQVFVFDDGGDIEAYKQEKYTNQTVLSSAKTFVDCTPGSKKIVVVANAPELSDVTSYDDLNGKTSFLADNGTRNFQMIGETDLEVVAATEITIPISRIAAKIKIASITNNMSLDYYKDMSFSITNIFMLNVVGTTGYLGDKTPESWYNMMQREDNGSLRYMLDRNNSTPITVNYSETVTFTQDQEHAYYVYPNSTETDSSDQENWCPRYTRMVLEARLGSEIYYYPVSIPGIERNTAYEVHLTVTRPGSSLPDVPVDVVAVSITVNVVDWNDGAMVNETI
jgi:hypothetical protein